MRPDRIDAVLVIASALTCGAFLGMYAMQPSELSVPVLYHCTIDDSQRQSGIPRACIIPATCEKNARRIAEDRCHWHGKTFYCVPMTKNYPDIIQMEITP